jgi:glycosyltransferase involved in cell wall biosynthesis
MACGCCVIASAVGGVPEMVEEGRSGFLFPPGDAAALADRLRAVVEDSKLRLTSGTAAAVRARDTFSMEAAAQRMESLYDSLL